jgi:hypothetical protein
MIAPFHQMYLPTVLSNSSTSSASTAASSSSPAVTTAAAAGYTNSHLLNLALTHSHPHDHSHDHKPLSNSSHNLSAILSRQTADETDFKRPLDTIGRFESKTDASLLSMLSPLGEAGAAAAVTPTTVSKPPSNGAAPNVLTAFLDAAHHNFLVKHENHVDALIDGRLLSLNHRFEEHDISTVIEVCDDSSMKHGDNNDCEHDHHGKGHHSEKKIELHSPTSPEPSVQHHHAIGCGHIAVQHGDHTDFLVGHHLHHPSVGEDGHCVNHGHINMLSIDALYADGGLDATSWRELFAAESLFSASTAGS